MYLLHCAVVEKTYSRRIYVTYRYSLKVWWSKPSHQIHYSIKMKAFATNDPAVSAHHHQRKWKTLASSCWPPQTNRVGSPALLNSSLSLLSQLNSEISFLTLSLSLSLSRHIHAEVCWSQRICLSMLEMIEDFSNWVPKISYFYNPSWLCFF